MSKPKNVPAEPFNPQLNPVMQAIRRDPEAPMPGAKSTGKLHPVTEALRFLRGAQHDSLRDEADAEECADALEAYQGELMRGVAEANERADTMAKKFAGFIDAVAVAVSMDEGSDSDDVLQTLVNHFEGVATPLIADVSGADAEAFLRDASQHRGKILPMEPERPYFETVQGVAKVIEQHNGIALAAPLHDLPRILSAMLADLRNEGESAQGRAMLETLQALAEMFGTPKDISDRADLNAIVTAVRELQANQKPADFEDAVQKLVDASTRKENAIEAIKTILRLA